MEKEVKTFLLNKANEKKEIKVHFTEDDRVNGLINDLEHYPHAYVLACFMDRQVKAEKAWSIPYYVKEALGDFSMQTLVNTTRKRYIEIFKEKNLHRFNEKMADVFFSGVKRIHDVYYDDVTKIWKGRPGSAEVVNKFMEFEGVGIKIATMTANILVRQFEIELSEYHFIDVSPDIQVRKVFGKLGLIQKGASQEQIIGVAREINPDYPGIVDGILWEVGRTYCKYNKPDCDKGCYLRDGCKFYKEHHK